MKRKISTSNGTVEVLQQGELKKIGDHYYFAAMYSGFQRISELSTGFALPKVVSLDEAEGFLNNLPEGKIKSAMEYAEFKMIDQGIPFPLNVN